MIKKLMAAALLALPLIGFVSCSDNKDLPDVDYNIEIEGGTRVDGSVYVVRGDTLEVESITVSNREEGKAAMITSAAYYWDGYYIGTAVIAPYGMQIITDEDTALGKHALDIQTPLFAEDKEAATAVVGLQVVVVESTEDIPGGGAETFVVTPSTQGNPD